MSDMAYDTRTASEEVGMGNGWVTGREEHCEYSTLEVPVGNPNLRSHPRLDQSDWGSEKLWCKPQKGRWIQLASIPVVICMERTTDPPEGSLDADEQPPITPKVARDLPLG